MKQNFRLKLSPAFRSVVEPKRQETFVMMVERPAIDDGGDLADLVTRQTSNIR
ncbi:hypothetical protein [Rhizobium sp. C4]|uniref:hypothetical protein n=1 Tax=Rhizobium sp. C4 TaxID=1349800 RepID=UPI001E44E8F8|nr:hypothetical protein [Rhizobium sp. C4]MCD2172301.1 hypothetical protein [Rhizobium sp. C4]